MPATQADVTPNLTPAQIAREHDCHPSAPLRWIQRGCVLASGEELRLKATRTPKSWKVARADLDEFFAALTADRLQPAAPAEAPLKPRVERIRKLNAELAGAGF